MFFGLVLVDACHRRMSLQHLFNVVATESQLPVQVEPARCRKTVSESPGNACLKNECCEEGSKAANQVMCKVACVTAEEVKS